MSRIELAKISEISFGYGGYQDVQFGISISFSGKGFGVSDFKGFWSLDIEANERTEWTEQDRDKIYAEMMRWINTIMKKAKVYDLDQLKNIPVELTFEGSGHGCSGLESWRILEEVL